VASSTGNVPVYRKKAKRIMSEISHDRVEKRFSFLPSPRILTRLQSEAENDRSVYRDPMNGKRDPVKPGLPSTACSTIEVIPSIYPRLPFREASRTYKNFKLGRIANDVGMVDSNEFPSKLAKTSWFNPSND
jgi:hypothetical protein